jgi:hypothetical protein
VPWGGCCGKTTLRESTIVYDETPIQVYMQRIHERLAHGRMALSELFAWGCTNPR